MSPDANEETKMMTYLAAIACTAILVSQFVLVVITVRRQTREALARKWGK